LIQIGEDLIKNLIFRCLADGLYQAVATELLIPSIARFGQAVAMHQDLVVIRNRCVLQHFLGVDVRLDTKW